MTTTDIDTTEWTALRTALLIALHDVDVLLPREVVLQLFDAVVDELVDRGVHLVENDDALIGAFDDVEVER